MDNRWIWPFELEEKIGDGGMGVVYRARYVKDNRRFAVKLLPLDLGDQTILARFEREMEVMKTLKHPNIVRCFGGVCGDKQRFYAMELVEGGTLAEVLRERQRLPWDQVIEYGLQMCRALGYAHSTGVVHRDVKPGNFLITNTGKLKLSDFGLIAVAAASRLTDAGKTMGTIPYMAPEQIRGTPPASPQTDLYGLGCVLFEMIVGHPPFKGDTPAATMHLHLHETPPRVSRFNRECPRSLERLVQKLLEKDPEQRPADATAVSKELEDIWQAAALGAETVDASTREPSDLHPIRREAQPRSKPRSLQDWLLGGSVAVIFALLVWNLILLGNLREQSRAEELWFEEMKSGDVNMRIAAAKALGEIDAQPEQAVNSLVLGLSDSNPLVRHQCIRSLAAFEADARPAVTALMRLANADPNSQVREETARTLERIRNAEEGGAGWPIYLLGILVLIGSGAGFLMVRKTVWK